jgi:hypothetical protein
MHFACVQAFTLLVLVLAAQYDSNRPKLSEIIVELEFDLAPVCSDTDKSYFNSSPGGCQSFHVPRPTEPIRIRELDALGAQQLRKRYPFVLPSLLPERALEDAILNASRNKMERTQSSAT